MSDEMCIESISGIQKELQNLASFDIRVSFVHFCEVANLKIIHKKI
jgi:hypothetical protein